MSLVCPLDGTALARIGECCSSTPLFKCSYGHVFEARPVYQQKPCLPIVGCFGAETVTCSILGFTVGSMPEYACSGIKLVLLAAGIGIGLYILKSLLFRKKEQPKRIAIEI
jgi:hypothetical protein